MKNEVYLSADEERSNQNVNLNGQKEGPSGSFFNLPYFSGVYLSQVISAVLALLAT